MHSDLKYKFPDDGLGIKAKMLDFDETDLFQSLMTNLSIVGTIHILNKCIFY